MCIFTEPYLDKEIREVEKIIDRLLTERNEGRLEVGLE